jgi:hypothetical protein
MSDPEFLACTPLPVNPKAFNPTAELPYGLSTINIRKSMEGFIEFLGFLNSQLHSRQLARLEAFMMPANFSSMVGEFMASLIPTHCKTLQRNAYHNGHPDLVPTGKYKDNAVRHGADGIEIKSSRNIRGWQGHNAEDTWLMVFVFESNSSRDGLTGIAPKQFRFVKVVGARLEKSDWQFSGRSATSRRTITASVTRSGFEKMEANWIYRD